MQGLFTSGLKLGAAAVVLAVLLAAPGRGLRAQPQAAEAPLKAAILVNLLMFVEWPVRGLQAADRLTLCYLAANPVTAELEGLAGKSLKNRTLMVSRVPLAGVGQCHALYLGRDDIEQLPSLVFRLKSSGILLLADAPGFFQRGVMFNLALDAGRIVFDVDLLAARQADLLISSKVLRLARHLQE